MSTPKIDKQNGSSTEIDILYKFYVGTIETGFNSTLIVSANGCVIVSEITSETHLQRTIHESMLTYKLPKEKLCLPDL